MMSEDAGGETDRVEEESLEGNEKRILSKCEGETSVWESWQMDVENQSWVFFCDVHTHVHVAEKH